MQLSWPWIVTRCLQGKRSEALGSAISSFGERERRCRICSRASVGFLYLRFWAYSLSRHMSQGSSLNVTFCLLFMGEGFQGFYSRVGARAAEKPF